MRRTFSSVIGSGWRTLRSPWGWAVLSSDSAAHVCGGAQGSPPLLQTQRGGILWDGEQPGSSSAIPPHSNGHKTNPAGLNSTQDCAQIKVRSHRSPCSPWYKHFIWLGQTKFTTACTLLTLLSTHSDALCTHLLKSSNCTYLCSTKAKLDKETQN